MTFFDLLFVRRRRTIRAPLPDDPSPSAENRKPYLFTQRESSCFGRIILDAFAALSFVFQFLGNQAYLSHTSSATGKQDGFFEALSRGLRDFEVLIM
ncbi:hypothetical protein T265_07412 [Opisthorchis viverrini]|uniref:Uncharacterized protein n=1 Tax=Opisthorchis viverrini TaxID=6198 RepID=A0A074ZD15_OPIVI|nr:hypothetical protein T265_07412 [Opisthorchis viverrini]KER25078.1 hypothetical protein T265_07412 [Opisthorchis viverrini]